MSWSMYAVTKTGAEMKRYVSALSESNVPSDARAAICAAVDLAGLDGDANPRIVAVKVQANGHKPGGSVSIQVEPIYLSA